MESIAAVTARIAEIVGDPRPQVSPFADLLAAQLAPPGRSGGSERPEGSPPVSPAAALVGDPGARGVTLGAVLQRPAPLFGAGSALAAMATRATT
jgi:hypothetical protein